MDTPKNIRQVGDIDSSHKIYIEDYVVTYTKNLGKEPGNKAAVLLGHKKVNKKDVETYINGLVVIEEFSLAGEAVFSNEKWSSIYDSIKKYYNDEEIVGWLFIGDEYDVQTDKRLVNIHTNNFNGKNVVFMNYNCIEKEETFYDYINSAFVKRKGFYIYYQKNETMHEYMIAMTSDNIVQETVPETVVKDFRSIMAKHGEAKGSGKLIRPAYAVGMVAAAFVLLVGTTVIYKYNDRPDKDAVNTVSYNIPGEVTGQAVISYGADFAGVTSSAEETVSGEEISEPAADAEPAEDDTSTDGTSDNSAVSTETGGVMAASFYIVKPGDSLGRISEKIYNSVHYVNMIKELNNIEDVDKIAVGQKILLPDVK